MEELLREEAQGSRARPKEHPVYHITVEEVFDLDGNVTYRLLNKGVVAGDRLFRKDYPGNNWPFRPGEIWNRSHDREVAHRNAAALQKYLLKLKTPTKGE